MTREQEKSRDQSRKVMRNAKAEGMPLPEIKVEPNLEYFDNVIPGANSVIPIEPIEKTEDVKPLVEIDAQALKEKMATEMANELEKINNDAAIANQKFDEDQKKADEEQAKHKQELAVESVKRSRKNIIIATGITVGVLVLGVVVWIKCKS